MLGVGSLGDFMVNYLDPRTYFGHAGPLGRVIYDNFFDDRTKYMWDDIMRGVPLVGDFLRTQDNLNFYDDYFRNHPDVGGYGNIKYHRANLGVGSSVSNSVRFASKNIEKFYDNW